MSTTTDIISTIASAISAIAAIITTTGIWYARSQLKASREIAQSQFEDALGKEYRELANRLNAKALLGEDLSEREYKKSFDEILHYIDLSNEQIHLRKCNRIGQETWKNWSAGIRSNLALPAFARAWKEVKEKSSSFEELRRFELEEESDPQN